MMLAERYTGQNVVGWWLSEKYDGCRAFWDGSCLRTRSWLPIAAPDWFTASLPKGKALDGELWAGRQTFQLMRVLVQFPRADSNEWKRVKFMVFDAPNTDSVPFEVRQQTATGRISGQFFQLAPQRLITSQDDLNAEFAQVVKNGGEGLMLRRPRHVYEYGRSRSWLKMKPAGVD